MGDFRKDEVSRDELIRLMAGGAELEALTRELQKAAKGDEALLPPRQEFKEEVGALEQSAEQ